MAFKNNTNYVDLLRRCKGKASLVESWNMKNDLEDGMHGAVYAVWGRSDERSHAIEYSESARQSVSNETIKEFESVVCYENLIALVNLIFYFSELEKIAYKLLKGMTISK